MDACFAVTESHITIYNVLSIYIYIGYTCHCISLTQRFTYEIYLVPELVSTDLSRDSVRETLQAADTTEARWRE